MARTTPVPSLYLRTLGAPALLAGGSDAKLRRKDLALLVYLRIESANTHARSTLASLLWAENTEREARHSLSQALVRLRGHLGRDAFATTRELVGWAGRLPCDAVRLEEIADGEEVRDEMLRLYVGDFMAGFSPGTGGGDFERWLEQRRTGYRDLAVRLLERCGEEAEEKEEWEDALRLGGRLVEIDPFRESGHRRIMRALHRTGERARALLHFEAYEKRLADEIGLDPHPDTQRLAQEIRESAGTDEPTPEPPARSLPVPPPEPEPEPGPTPRAEPAAPAPPVPHPRQSSVTIPAAGPPSHPAISPLAARRHPTRRRAFPVLLGAAAIAGLLALAWWRTARPAGDAQPPSAALTPEPHNGESVRFPGQETGFLAFGRKLYAYPDAETLAVCTGFHPSTVREVQALPRWDRLRLPSVRENQWMAGATPLKSSSATDLTAYVAVGCVLGAIPNPAIYLGIFGDQDWNRMALVADSVLERMPRFTVGDGYPLRPAGTLVRSPEGELKWVVFYGGALRIAGKATLRSYCRSPAEAVPVTADEFGFYLAQGELSRARPPCSR